MIYISVVSIELGVCVIRNNSNFSKVYWGGVNLEGFLSYDCVKIES